MPFERLNKDMGIIAKLDDEPNDVTGLTAAELKDRFDEGGKALKEYINSSLLPALEGAGGAGSLGAAPFGRISGTNIQEQIRQVAGSVDQVALGQIPDKSIGADKLADGAVTADKLPNYAIGPEKLTEALLHYYTAFEPEDWRVITAGQKAQLRIGRGVHGLPTGRSILAKTLHMRLHRSARDYTAANLADGRTKFLDLQKAALEANKRAAGTYPVATDGHVQLTWEQVQYYLLEGVLTSAAAAASQAAALGFNWKGIDTCGVPQTTTLDQLLTAAYLPALGGSAAQLNSLWTLAAVRGLRLRSPVSGQTGEGKRWDCVGRMSGRTWGVYETHVELDTGTGELVLTGPEPYAGEVLVIAGRKGA